MAGATTGEVRGEVDDTDPTWGGRPIRFPRIQGADAVGTVGKRVMIDGWRRGWSDPDNPDKAGHFGSEVDAGFAEYTRCDVRGVALVRSELTDPELATFACAYTTAEGTRYPVPRCDPDRDSRKTG